MRAGAQYWTGTRYLSVSRLLHAVRAGRTVASQYFDQPFRDWFGESPRLSATESSPGSGSFGGWLANAGQLSTAFRPRCRDIGGADGATLAGCCQRARPRWRRVRPADRDQYSLSDNRRSRTRIACGPRALLFSKECLSRHITCSRWRYRAGTTSAVAIRTQHLSETATLWALLVEMVMPEGDAPDFSKLVDMTILGIFGSRERTKPQWRRLLEDAASTIDSIVSGTAAMSIIEATRSDP
jgi:hypothetical protein